MNRIQFVVICLFSLVISSCDPAWEADVSVYATNSTSKNIKIKMKNNTLYEDYAISEILPNTERIKLTGYSNFNGTGLAGSGCLEILIYNSNDSTFTILDNCSENYELYFKYVEEEYFYLPTSTKMNSVNQCELHVNIVVNDSLLMQMTKNTIFTDSIFGLQ